MSAKKPTRAQAKIINKLSLDATAYLVYHWPPDNTRTPIVLVNRYTREKIKRLLPSPINSK